MAIILPFLSLILPVLGASLPGSFPHVYPGQPTGSLSPQWQSYFEVKQQSLPNITFSLDGRSFAGNIPVQRAGHPNDTLFFWAFEKQSGSLTDPGNTEPWGIWLNGGPGSSSMFGLFFENGPIRINPDYSATANNYSWNKVADYIWIDQPVGTGFSTADSNGYIADDDQMAQDFLGFLGNLVKVFPTLATRPLIITGESYAGNWIPYITKAYFALANPPVKLAKIAIGDGTVPSGPVFELLPSLSIIETYPQLIGYDQDVYNYFKEQSHLCGYDINLTYPQTGIIPSVALVEAPERNVIWEMQQSAMKKGLFKTLLAKNYEAPRSNALMRRSQAAARAEWKRDLAGRANGTIDPWYGCILITEFIDYAINFTFPWTLCKDDPNQGCFDVYDAQDALFPEANQDASVFLNNNATRAALHAPTSKDWALSVQVYANQVGDPSPEPMVFMSELATNATAKNVSIILYSGNDDTLIAHRGTEVAIQNTTFGGIQGFTRKPSTPWFDDAGNFAGIVHQERGWTYVLFKGAGHLVPAKSPATAFIFLREFVFGSNKTGLVTTSSDGSVTVIGGENSTLAADILPGQDGIFYGSGATQSTYIFPEATRAAWKSFIQTATATPMTTTVKNDSNAGHLSSPTNILCIFVSLFVLWFL